MNVVVYQHSNENGHPEEDFYLIGHDQRIFAVADGVTRDRYTNSWSGAAVAARLFCQLVIESLDMNRQDLSICEFKRAFDRANGAIRSINEEAGIWHNTDYLENDYFGAVGVAAAICQDNCLYYGYVGDCSLVLLDSHGAVRFTTDDQVAPVRQYLDTLRSSSVMSPAARRWLVRSQIRNNSHYTDEAGTYIGYGVLTGEDGVRDFYRFGMERLNAGEVVILSSDGFAPLLAQSALREEIGQLAAHSGRCIEAITRAHSELSLVRPGILRDDITAVITRVSGRV
jgi:serine/threonine protein phosphatase PrpC